MMLKSVPNLNEYKAKKISQKFERFFVGPEGFEPPTLWV